MVDYKQDLWPDEIKTTEIISPVTIIKEQGKILGRKTNNIVVGEVKTFNSSTKLIDFPFTYRFVLVCSSINYEYRLFDFAFPIEIYPIKIIPDTSIANELSLSPRNPEIKIDLEEEFIEILKKIFSAQKTVKIITTLLAQSQDIKDES
ncbi:hypothetical protein cce_2441 [Crocosphaera subtropica ATCC 51142]|uniref:Uncharacterized protein n=1 Tax=Crocosphaera subtropica (strain ATCC 51142 / BH68) TaxID=43989 RepID=B1WRE0_CROS5|nr:hypothetical protein [Crocosphaera subtropica]ACB51789.1 hypothetical protein cce_2441 [Crocosphaera subtropica ATCC 51142]